MTLEFSSLSSAINAENENQMLLLQTSCSLTTPLPAQLPAVRNVCSSDLPFYKQKLDRKTLLSYLLKFGVHILK